MNKRRWVKKSIFWDHPNPSTKAHALLNKWANRKWRKAFKNIPTRELEDYEPKLQKGCCNWWH